MAARSSAAQSSPPPGILEHHHPGTQSMAASPRSPLLAADANPVNPFLFSFSSSSDICWILPPLTPGIGTPALHSIATPCLLLAAAAPHRVRLSSRRPQLACFPQRLLVDLLAKATSTFSRKVTSEDPAHKVHTISS
ncbi:hypothetical protein VPH35_078249 [Triticum aestivum]|uniref:Uncharacterized protein n=2 Tax=Aegilops tauschii TaxID=37682 RepID=A0A453I7N3_AEGTS